MKIKTYPKYRVTYSNGVTQTLTLIAQVTFNRYNMLKKELEDEKTFKTHSEDLKKAMLEEWEELKWIGPALKKGSIFTSDSPMGRALIVATVNIESIAEVVMDGTCMGNFEFSFEWLNCKEVMSTFGELLETI